MTEQTSDYIYVNGCSFTFGIGIRPLPPSEEMFDLRWGTLLANSLGTDVVNDSCPGSCNERIFRTTYNSILSAEKKPKLAVVMWSDPPRTEIFRPQENELSYIDLAQINPQSIGKIGSEEHLEAFKLYYAFIHSGERATIQTMTYMLALKHLFESFDIPFVMLHYKANFYNEVKRIEKKWSSETKAKVIESYYNRFTSLRELLSHPHIFGFENNFSFDTLLQEKKVPFSIYSGGHPDEYGHQVMAEWLIDYTKELSI